jgi:tetratricopeptide (TPR) repeat protein
VNNFADLCAQEGQLLDEAIERLAPMVQQNAPRRAYGLDTLGWLYHRRGDERRAAETLELALEEAGREETALRATVHEHLAAVYTALGRLGEAAAQEDEARRLRASMEGAVNAPEGD